MSTFKIEGEKILISAFPERNWKEQELARFEKVFQKLSNIDKLKSEVLTYIKDKMIRIGFHKQYKSGGGVFHLRQTVWMRLSMQGKLRACQYQKETYPSIAKTSGGEIGSEDEDYGAGKASKDFWDEPAKMNPESRNNLEKAQEVMTNISPGYCSGCLPWYPSGKKFKYFGRCKEYVSALSTFGKWVLVDRVYYV